MCECVYHCHKNSAQSDLYVFFINVKINRLLQGDEEEGNFVSMGGKPQANPANTKKLVGAHYCSINVGRCFI